MYLEERKDKLDNLQQILLDETNIRKTRNSKSWFESIILITSPAMQTFESHMKEDNV